MKWGKQSPNHELWELIATEEDCLLGRENDVSAILPSDLGSGTHLPNNSVVGQQGQGGTISIPYLGTSVSICVFVHLCINCVTSIMLFEKRLRYSLQIVGILVSRAGRSLQRSSLQWHPVLLKKTSLLLGSTSFIVPFNFFHHSLYPAACEDLSCLYLMWAADYFLPLFRNFDTSKDKHDVSFQSSFL